MTLNDYVMAQAARCKRNECHLTLYAKDTAELLKMIEEHDRIHLLQNAFEQRTVKAIIVFEGVEPQP